MKKIFFYSLVLLKIPLVNAQENKPIYFQPDFGLSIGTGDDITNVYGIGGQISLGLSFLVTKTFRITPNISSNYHGNNFNESSRDNLLIWNLGTILEISIKDSDKLSLSPLLGINYLTGSSYLTPRRDFDGDRVDIYSFNGYSLDLGFRVIFENNIYLLARFRIMNPKGNVDEQIKSDIRSELEANNSLYEIISFPEEKFSLSTISVSIGYRLKLE